MLKKENNQDSAQNYSSADDSSPKQGQRQSSEGRRPSQPESGNGKRPGQDRPGRGGRYSGNGRRRPGGKAPARVSSNSAGASERQNKAIDEDVAALDKEPRSTAPPESSMNVQELKEMGINVEDSK